MIPHATAIVLATALIAGCSTAAFHHKDPHRHVVVLDKTPISVLKIDNNRWEAWGGDSTAPNHEQFERQIKAIAITSGCTVTDASLDPKDARRMVATVKCAAPVQSLSTM